MPCQTENTICGVADRKMCFAIGFFDFLINILLILCLLIYCNIGKGGIVVFTYILISVNTFLIILMIFGLIKANTNFILPYLIAKYVIICSSIGAVVIMVVLIFSVEIGMAGMFIPFIVVTCLISFLLNIMPLLIVRKFYQKLIINGNQCIDGGYNGLSMSLQ